MMKQGKEKMVTYCRQVLVGDGDDVISGSLQNLSGVESGCFSNGGF